MNASIRVTALVENSVHSPGLRGENGLSFHLQAGAESLLFDTGQSDLILHNAARLRIALDKVDAIVLSHGHYDHTTGLETILKLAPKARLFMHPMAVGTKYVLEKDGRSRSIGMPESCYAAMRAEEREIIPTIGRTEIVPGIFATGEIPRVTPFEPEEPSFFQDPTCKKRDGIRDDQALFFDSKEGIVVLLGCAHSGVINTLEHIRKLGGTRPFHALIGGMHLLKGDKKRIQSTVEALRKFNFKIIAPGHCTGSLATAMLWSSFEGSCVPCSTGTVFSFS